jgi:Flp pilus assembly protein TadG
MNSETLRNAGPCLSLTAIVTRFSRARRGNVTMLFAASMLPILTSIGAAVDYSRHVGATSRMRSALDGATLAVMPMAAKLSASDLQTRAQEAFQAGYRMAGAVTVSATYDPATAILNMEAQGAHPTSFLNIVGIQETWLRAAAKSKMSGGPLLPICVMVTDPDSGHTLLAKDDATIDFDRCMVQVNTANWDAVESRDTSYIHSTNGQNCFVGDIHYGDVLPPKSPTCAFFSDPFATLAEPGRACDHINKVVNTAGEVLSPGTYCGGLLINASTKFLPGLYVVRDGKFQVVGSGTNVQAEDVTFVLSGKNAGFFSNSTGTFNITPNSTTISGTRLTGSGIFYFVGQSLKIEDRADVRIEPGSIIADFILPVAAKLQLKGELAAGSLNEAALQKVGYGEGSPMLIE